jgi:hypothetical protein
MDLVMPYLLGFDIQMPGLALARENGEATGTSPCSTTCARKPLSIDMDPCWYGDHHVNGYGDIVHARVEYEYLNETVLVRRDLVVNRP